VEMGRVRELKKDIAGYETKIKRRKAEIRQSNSRLSDLASGGNGWASNKLNRMLENDESIQRFNALLKQAETAKLKLETSNTIAETVSAVNQANLVSLETNQRTRQTYEGLFGFFGAFCIAVFILATVILNLYEIETEGRGIEKPIPSDIQPVSGASLADDRKAETALKLAVENRGKIETIEMAEPVSDVSKPEYSPENSKPEPVSETQPEMFQIVSKGNTRAIWVPGFKTEPFSVSQCRSKLKQYQYKLKQGKGKAETNRDNIAKFQKAIKILNK